MSKDSARKSVATLARDAAFQKRADTWPPVLAEDAASAEAEAA